MLGAQMAAQRNAAIPALETHHIFRLIDSGERSLGDVKRGGCDGLFSALGIKFGRSILDIVTTGVCYVGSEVAIVVQAAPVFAMLVACNLLIPKASWPDGAPLSLAVRPMYLLGSGQLVPRSSDS